MYALLNLVRREPTRFVGLVIAFLALLSAFGLSLGDKQTAALMGVIYAILSLVGTEVVRSQVTPAANVPDISALTNEVPPASSDDEAAAAESNVDASTDDAAQDPIR